MGAVTLTERLFRRAGELGLDDDELARFSALAPERVRIIRAGAELSAFEYEQLCRAVAVDPSVLYGGEDLSPLRIPARFRAATSMDRPNARDVRLLALASEQGRALAHLLRLLGRPVPLEAHRQVRAVRGRAETWKEGYDLGEAARRRLAPGASPLADVEALFNGLGIHVARVELSSPDVDAACVWEPGAVPVVLVNRLGPASAHPGALRASLAHELCHLLHDAGTNGLTTRMSWGVEGTGNYAEAQEVRARAFAPAFLAPRPAVGAWAAGLRGSVRTRDAALVKALAERWGLSFEGAAWHAKNCGLVPAERAEALARQGRKPRISYEDFVGPPTFMAPPSMVHEALPEVPAPLWDGWAGQVVLQAWERGEISLGRARELLTWA